MQKHGGCDDSQINQTVLSRREALRLLGLAVGSCALLPELAFGKPSDETQHKIDQAQAQYDKKKQDLEDLSIEAEKVNVELSDTMGKIDQLQTDIQKTQGKIEEQEESLKQRQQTLAERVSKTYKLGPSSLLNLVLSSTTFDELTSNIYYADRIAQYDQDLVSEIQQTQKQLEEEKASLNNQLATQERLRETQQEQVERYQKKQAEVQELMSSLSADIERLGTQRDKEIAEELEAARIAEQKRKEEEERRRKQQEANNYAGGGNRPDTADSIDSSGGSGSLARVLSSCHSTPSPGAGMCAAWVSRVFANAGFGYYGGNANNMYWSWCKSSNRASLKPGMIVAVSTHPGTPAGRIYGHIGIYIGGGLIMDNIGYINTQGLDSWISYYGKTVPVRWGWIGGIALS